MKNTSKILLVFSAILLFLGPQNAAAYIGPGTGLSAIGAFLAFIFGIIVAILGFLWYPFKRIFGKKKSQEPDEIKGENE